MCMCRDKDLNNCFHEKSFLTHQFNIFLIKKQKLFHFQKTKLFLDTKTKGHKPQLEAVCSTDVHHMEWTLLICCTLQLFIYIRGLIQGNICPLCLSGCLHDPCTMFPNKTPPYCLALLSRAQVQNPVRHLESPAVAIEAGRTQTPGDLVCATRISSRRQAITWLCFVFQ